MSEEGFTLLEAMIALSIIAIALPVLLTLRNFDIELESRARTITKATLFAQEKLVEIELIGFVQTGDQSGDLQFGLRHGAKTEEERYPTPGFTWNRQVTATPFKGIREIRLRILSDANPAENVVEVSSYVFQARPH